MKPAPMTMRSRSVMVRRTKERGRRHNRHEAEAADLNEQQDDALAEKRPVERGADRDKSGDAGRARRGKECVKDGGCAAAFRRERRMDSSDSRPELEVQNPPRSQSLRASRGFSAHVSERSP